MSEPVTWGDLVTAARRKAAELASDPRAQQALSLASASASEAARRLDPALRIMQRDDTALDEVYTAVDELVEVVLVQQDLIENLLTRMSSLERHIHLKPKGKEAG